MITRYLNPLNEKKSALMCCHGHYGAGVDLSGCHGSCGWCHWHVAHDSTMCLMSWLMPGQ